MQKRFLIPIATVLCLGVILLVRWAGEKPVPGVASDSAQILTAAERVKSLQLRAKRNNGKLAAAKALPGLLESKHISTNSGTTLYGTRWGRESEPELRQFSAWAGQFASATPAQKGPLIDVGIELAKERRLAMADLIEYDPAAAVSAAAPQSVLAELPESVLAHMERRVSGVGNLDVYGIVPDRGAKRSAPPIERTARLGGRTYQAHTYGVLSQFGTVKDLYMHGVAVDGRIALADAPVRALETGEALDANKAVVASHSVHLDPTLLAQNAGPKPRLAEGAEGYHCLCCSVEAKADYAGSRWAALGEDGTIAAAIGRAYRNTGSKSILFIPVEFPDRLGEPVSSDALVDSRIADIQSFFSTASYGLFNLNNATSTDLETLPSNRAAYRTSGGGYTTATLKTDAAALALAAGYNVADYDFVSIVINHNLWTGVDGVGELGEKYSFIDGSSSGSEQDQLAAVYIHELGHNLGLHHAGSWDPTGLVSDSSTGTTSEYGNRFDAMGNNLSTYTSAQLHYNASFKNALDWLPNSYITTASANTSVTLNLYAMDQTQVSGRTYGVKMPAGMTLDGVTGLDYWVEFRSRYTGVNTVENGVLIYTANTAHDAYASKLLDMAPTTSSFVDAGLPVGSTFTTADSMWRITVNSQSGSGANSLINVTVSAFAPTITTQPTSVTTSYGSAVSFSVVATGTSLTYQWLKDNVTLTGETSATLSIPNFQSANSGSYTVIVTNANGSVTSNAATLAVSESSGGGGGGGCGYTTPPEQILLIGWAVLLLCRLFLSSAIPAGLPAPGFPRAQKPEPAS